MRLISDDRSVENTEHSILSIVETIVCTVVILYFLPFEDFAYWAMGFIALGWLLLLRTKESTELGLRIYLPARVVLDKGLQWFFEETYLDEINDPGKYIVKSESGIPISSKQMGGAGVAVFGEWIFGNVFRSVGLLTGYSLYILANLLISVFAKISATLWQTVTKPRLSLSSVPANWQRYAFCIDLNRPVEFVPGFIEFHGIENKSIQFDDIRWQCLLREFKEMPYHCAFVFGVTFFIFNPFDITIKLFDFVSAVHYWLANINGFMFAIVWFVTIGLAVLSLHLVTLWVSLIFKTPLRLLLFLPAYIYRIMLKGTFIAYFPLSWFVIPFDNLKKLNPTVSSKSELFKNLNNVFVKQKSLLSFISAVFIIFIITKYIQIDDQISLFAWMFSLECGPSKLCEQLVKLFVIPGDIPLWHFTSFINAILYLVVINYTFNQMQNFDANNVKVESLAVGVSRYLIFASIISIFSWSANIAIAIMNYDALKELLPAISFPKIGCFYPILCDEYG